ncbi:MAG TPA: serine/threonine-protein kinase [Bryobacteraceae bacterium]|jgi:serine/threonine protein kinase
MNQLVRQLFEELATLTPAERESILAERPVAPSVRAEVESLLSFDLAQGDNLSACVADAAAEMLRAADGRPTGDWGPYRGVRLLGSGGMGAVYLAERRDGEIEQKVAVKLLADGGNRPAWRERFLKERQLLASLNHPSIVHVIDAGHTADGQPYLAMEYVDGVAIDLYAARTAVRERLKLFLRVCEGVAYAHRHLIVHRDLKPSNILVDCSGQPKLLDFGIAKLLDETGDSTRTVERLLTPNYASPEQLRGSSQTTATDVYSLGAVLYKLLTGRSPHETGGNPAATVEVIAGARQIPPPTQLNPELPSDLDYILRKALRTEPEERYASVDAFADDIRALLDWRPVDARSGEVWYRTRRFLRRYWLPATAATVMLAGLSAGLYIANRERAVAQRRFLEVRQLANKLFEIDLEVRRSPGTTKARQLIVDTSLEYLRRLGADARGDPELGLEIGNAYMRVARVQGVPTSNNLGEMEQADESLRTAEGLIQSVLTAQPRNRMAMLRAAQIAHDRMILAWWLKRPKGQSLNFARKSAAWLDHYLKTGGIDNGETDGVFVSYTNVVKQYMREDQADEALRLGRRALDLARSVNEPRRAGALLEAIADIYRQRGDLDEALAASRESAHLLDPGAETADMTQMMNFVLALIREGRILDDDNSISLGRRQEAVAVLDRAFRITTDIAGRDPNDFNSGERFAGVGILLARELRHTDPARSVDIYDRALRRMAAVKNNTAARRREIDALAGSVFPLLQLHRYRDARQRLDAAFLRLNQLGLYPAEQIELGSLADDTLRARAEYEAATGNVAGAVDICEKLRALIFAAKPQPRPEASLEDAVELSNIYRQTAALYRRGHRPAPANGLEARRLELWRHWDTKLPHNAFVRRELETAGLR